MSDLEDFFDDDIDVAAFDAVLNAATSNPAPARQKQQQHHQQPAASSSTIDDCFDDDIDAAAFDAVVNAATSMPPPTSTTSRHQQPENSHTQGNQQKKYIQPTIFGASQVPPKPGRQNKQQPSTSSQYQQPAAPKKTQQEPKVKAVKKWDTLSAIKVLPDIMQAGKKQRKNKSKFAAMDDDDDDDDEEMMMMMDEEEELDSDTDLLAKALQEESSHKKIPMKLQSDDQAIKTWVYSINKPKRKYQYDIVARALYNNCLVSLPTGLGKTFIAAVVMLNFYRWYPRGKVIFLAPTRPLVQQQIEACHSIAGIPSVDCASLTGTTSAAKRAVAWEQKRVIFATPQTVANDLRRGSLRPEDIICIVVDEAHRATGAYAYCIVVKLMMRFNPHFRVLALTATPGSDPERVQAVIDNLHIGHIEVRTEESMDIVPYTKNKEIVLEKIPLTPELTSIRDKWGKLMLPLIKQCGALFHGSKEPAYIHAFSITSAQMRIPKERAYLRPNLSVLSKMATAMAKLLEYSIMLAYEKMLELKEESGKCAAGVCSQIGYKSLMTEIRDLTLSPDFVPHPKMEKMKALTLEFFLNAQDTGKSSRVMVFCHFRDMVTDIVNYLNQERPLIKASAFVGQSNDVRGNRGMNQKTQNETIQRFKNNEFNVLVATSIGEEGLDIGALDFIICYEAQKSPLRMLQRLGRTGRNEDGKVIVLIAEGREDKNWEKAQDQYQHVQNALLSKKVLELYEDCERLVPEGVRPTPVDKMIEVQPYIAEQVELSNVTASGRKKKDKPVKRKRPGVEDIPAGGIFGFVSAKDYAVPKSKAEALRHRSEAALLTADEAAVLHKQWSKNITCMPSPMDAENLKIAYLPTSSALGSRLEAIPSTKRFARNVTRSCTYSKIMDQCESYVDDEAKYEAWREDKMARLDSKNVKWWPLELRGKGAQKPLKLCTDGPNSIRRRWGRSSVAHESPGTLSPRVCSISSSAPSSPRRVSFAKVSDGSSKKQRTKAWSPPSSHSDLPDVTDLIPSMKTSERLLPPPVAPQPLGSTSSTATTVCGVEDGKRGNQTSGLQRLAAFKSKVGEPAPYEPAVVVRAAGASRDQPPPVTPSGPSGGRATGGKRPLMGPARLFEEDHQSPLLLRAMTQNKQQQRQATISPREYENGDEFVEPSCMLPPATQMPRGKRAQRPLESGGEHQAKVKRTIAPESSDEMEVHPGAGCASGDNDDDDDDDDDEKVPQDAPARQKQIPSRRHTHRSKKEGSSTLARKSSSKGKQKQVAARAPRGDQWALKTGLFDLEASESDSSSTGEDSEVDCDEGGRQKKRRRKGKKKRGGRLGRKSEEEEIASENSIDRDFLVNTSSSKIQDDCSPDKSMASFYRASILMMSQPLSVVKKKLGRPALPIEPSHPHPLHHPHHQQQQQHHHHHHQHHYGQTSAAGGLLAQSSSRLPPRAESSDRFVNSEENLDTFSYDSFCVPDEETIEYEEGHHPDGGGPSDDL